MAKLLHYFIVLVWLINGLYCKVFNQVPRHQEIVGEILSKEHARTLTIIIGLMEILLGVWIFFRRYPKPTAIFQIILVLSMNVIEFFLVPNLLLWGRFNLVFAILFAGLIFLEAFVLSSPPHQKNYGKLQ